MNDAVATTAASTTQPAILYHDACLLAVDKPPGLLSVPGRGIENQDCLSARVQRRYPAATIVHRLDMETSGVMLMALDARTHRELSRQFEAREVRKTYVAQVHGRILDEQGEIAAPLMKDMAHSLPPRHKVDYHAGKPASTHWRVVEFGCDRTRLELFPRTGRSHQLRVHLAHIGHPILGDAIYASPDAQALADRLMLHAWRIAFAHPQTRESIELESPLPF